MRFVVAGVLVLSAAVVVYAQEPRPATLDATEIGATSGVSLTYAWRFAGGDDPERARPGFDDDGWAIVEPRDAGPGETETGWFRRHIIVEPDFVGVPFNLPCPSLPD